MIRITLFLVFYLFAHSGFSQEKKVVVSSASMIWDMVNNIAGDKVESQLIVPIGGDPHIHEPSTTDALKVEGADLIFINGLTFEGWINELIENSGTKAETVTVTKGVAAISSTVYKNSSDPHAWMDASNGQIYIRNIKNALIKLDPANKVYYEARYDAYSERLSSLDKYIMEKIQSIPEERRVLITSHDAFSYYGKRYGLQVEGLMGISTESAARTSDRLRIDEAIKKSGVPAIFVESTVDPKLIKMIATDNNIDVADGELFADSIGGEDTEGNSYYDMLKSNTDLISSALIGTVQQASDHETSNTNNILAYGLVGLIMLLGLLFMILKLNK